MYSSDGYQALRHASAVVRRGDRGVLGVTGADRLVWLQGLLTNDVATLTPGSWRYAAYLTPQGRMITDMRVIELEDHTVLEVPALVAGSLAAKLDSLLFTEDAQVSDLSASIAVIELIGPDAPRVMALTGGRLAVPAVKAAIRDDGYGVPGVTLIADAPAAGELVAAMTSAGAKETTLETLDLLRVEAGRPLFLVDMDEHTIPLEAGLEDRAISFSKGCYVGQEVIVRVMHRGHGRVAKKLVGLVLAKDAAVARHGDLLCIGEREIGRVTSAAWSPALDRSIALGYVHRDFVEPGRVVDVHTHQGVASATVTALPFVASPAAS